MLGINCIGFQFILDEECVQKTLSGGNNVWQFNIVKFFKVTHHYIRFLYYDICLRKGIYHNSSFYEDYVNCRAERESLNVFFLLIFKIGIFSSAKYINMFLWMTNQTVHASLCVVFNIIYRVQTFSLQLCRSCKTEQQFPIPVTMTAICCGPGVRIKLQSQTVNSQRVLNLI